MQSRKADWDTRLYEGSHSFVWEHGFGLVDVLAPGAGERILDLGCGTGQLTARIAESGAEPLGIDNSPAMIAQARQNFPQVKFELADAHVFRGSTPFDAVFSNAALHWMNAADAVAETISAALRPGGRLVAEFGAHGNIAKIIAALKTGIRNYFPTVGEYAAVLERHSLEVVTASVFDRPTRLEGGEEGLREWVAMFRPDNRRPMREVEAELRGALFRDGQWTADYRRLRVVARKIR